MLACKGDRLLLQKQELHFLFHKMLDVQIVACFLDQGKSLSYAIGHGTIQRRQPMDWILPASWAMQNLAAVHHGAGLRAFFNEVMNDFYLRRSGLFRFLFRFEVFEAVRGRYFGICTETKMRENSYKSKQEARQAAAAERYDCAPRSDQQLLEEAQRRGEQHVEAQGCGESSKKKRKTKRAGAWPTNSTKRSIEFDVTPQAVQSHQLWAAEGKWGVALERQPLPNGKRIPLHQVHTHYALPMRNAYALDATEFFCHLAEQWI